MWRRFEKDRIKRKHKKKEAIPHLIGIVISIIDIIIFITLAIEPGLFFFIIMIIFLTYALKTNYIFHKEQVKKGHKPGTDQPFLSSVILGYLIFIAFFLGNLLGNIIPTIYYYTWGIIGVFFHAVMHNILKLTKGTKR
jgi:hypothetical protein